MDSEEEMLKSLFQQQHGFLISKIMFTACELGVFDLLLESEETLTSTVIAERLGTSHVGMERLLEACVGLKLLRIEKKDNEGLYGNTELANLCLAKSSPKSQYQYMKLLSDISYPSLQYLAEAVREGKNQIQSVFGTSEKDWFKVNCSSKEELQRFSSAMEDAWSLYGEDVMSALDLSCFHVVCDLGGSSDALAKKYISLYPNSKVTIFDLPEVVERAKNLVSSEEQRITFQGGGGVLIVETVLNEDRSGPIEAHIYSMRMLLYTEGKERTLSEYSGLLGAAGFNEIQFKKRKFLDVVFGRK